MKFVALISGGKDSFFNAMHCMQNGHTLAALANLHPADKTVNELDSFMFQTVGHDVVDLYRECVGSHVPLFRRAISGASANVSLEYEPTAHDEIEDLYELLREVQAADPDIEGVSCGAILSHYQRTRVENVCGRLGLTPLAYLWQREQPQLMQEMAALGLEAILIKVAAVGLTDAHLGRSLLDMYPILTKLNAMYDVHVCGEGGEFESLVLDAPFFSKKLVVVDSKVISSSLDSLHLQLTAEAQEKEGSSKTDVFVPPLLSEDFQLVLDSIPAASPREPLSVGTRARFSVRPSVVTLGTKLYISNLTSTLDTVEDQTRDIFAQLQLYLTQHSATARQIQHVTVLVDDMANFARINAVYGAFFEGMFLPPSRVCVETMLPSAVKLQVSCIVCHNQNEIDKLGIHIRSRSYWAPQNIGPYSQAIIETQKNLRCATLSGQIPLIPLSMELDEKASEAQNAVLALQHLYRVKTLIKTPFIANCVCYISEKSSPELAAQVWRSYVEEVEHGQKIHDRMFIVQTTALPKGASIEWGGMAFQRLVDMYEDDVAESDVVDRAVEDLLAPFSSALVRLGDSVLLTVLGTTLESLIDLLRSPALANMFVHVMTDLDTVHRLSNMGLLAAWTPVLGVWGADGSVYKYGVILIS